MKDTTMHQKDRPRDAHTNPRASAGPQGIALAPPAYGMDVVDSQPIQAGSAAIQRQAEDSAVCSTTPATPPVNRTGLPDSLKAGIESLAGLAMDDVRVHFNSPRPAQVQALAYTQGSDIHVAPGQQRHLPHEAWHVVQQKQGRVRATMQLKGTAINDDGGLEHEADVMGKQASRAPRVAQTPQDRDGRIQRSSYRAERISTGKTVQRLVGFEFECNGCPLQPAEGEGHAQKDQVLINGGGWKLAAEVVQGMPLRCVEFKTRAIDDQSPPKEMFQIMGQLSQAAETIAVNAEKGISVKALGEATGAKYESKFQNTIITANEDNYTARPQVTGGINFDRILDLLKDMIRQEDVPGSELMLVSKSESPQLQRIDDSIKEIDRRLSGRPPAYQGFIALLSAYIASAQSSVKAPKYFKAILPLASRMDLGVFMGHRDINDLGKCILDDVTKVIGKVDISDPMFPKGVYNDKRELVEVKMTVKEWVEGVIKGVDPVPWTLNVSQTGEPFKPEPTGPTRDKHERPLGVPLEIRSLKLDVPWPDWTALAMHLFSYIGDLNNWQHPPRPYQTMEQAKLAHKGLSISLLPKEKEERMIEEKSKGKRPLIKEPARKERIERRVTRDERMDDDQIVGLLRPLILNPAWDTKGKGFFGSTFVPSGIKLMRDVLAKGFDARDALTDIIVIAESRLGKQDNDRQRVTSWIYRIVQGARKYTSENLLKDINNVKDVLGGKTWYGPMWPSYDK